MPGYKQAAWDITLADHISEYLSKADDLTLLSPSVNGLSKMVGTFVRVLIVDYSNAFDHINHEMLIAKLYGMGLPAYLVRWMAAFLIDRQQSVKIGDTVSSIGYPNGGVPQGTLPGPKNFLVPINDLQTPCPMFKYVDDSTVFDVCNCAYATRVCRHYN